jgi:hypothetical protein
VVDPALDAAPTRAEVRLLWQQRLDRFASSGLSVAAFCRAEHPGVQSFYYWKRRLTAPPPSPAEAPGLLPVHLPPPAPPVEIVLRCGAVLRLLPGCDLAFVRTLLDAPGSPSC